MQKSYTIGGDFDLKDIQLSVTVRTEGLARTRVHQLINGGQLKFLNKSNATSNGNIPAEILGKGSELRNSRLRVRIYIDLRVEDEDRWEELVQRINTKVKLAGGFAGVQSYSHDNDDLDFDESTGLVSIDIYIKLIHT